MTFETGELVSIFYEKSLAVYIKETVKARIGFYPTHSNSLVFLVDSSEYQEVYTDYLRKIDDTAIST